MTLSWTNFGKVTPTRDQGSCGSCFAYAVNAALESYILIKQNASVDLSEQFLLECTPYASCGGGSVDYTFMTALSYNNPGVPLESAYPYKAYYGAYSKTAGICLAQNRRTHTKYTTFYRYANVTTAQLKSLIADSPVVVGMASSHYTFSFYKTGIYRCPFNPSVYELDHSVLAIGYDAMGNWLIKNSWGSSWGNGGFGWISNTADCGVKYWAYQVSERKVATYGWNLMGAAIMLMSILLTTSL
jgi:cathepsin L